MNIQTAFAFQTASPGDFATEMMHFTFNGQQSRCEIVNGIPYVFNEFWTAKQRDAHSIHEVSYRACFKAQLPDFFIQRLTRPGDVVYDPFMGRGTTVVQATLTGRNAIGNDINPLSALLCRPRTAPPMLSAVIERLGEIDWQDDEPGHDELLVFYHPDTLRQILALRRWLKARGTSGTLDAVDDWIRMVAINRLTGHSPGFFSVYSLPPNQAVSLESQKRINEKRNQVPPPRSVRDIIVKKSRSLLKDGADRNGKATFLTNSADCTPHIPDHSVDLVVTSPPFLDIVQYASNNWLRCWFAGFDARSVDIAMHRKPESWRDFVRNVFAELARVVKPGGHVAFEVGEVRNGRVELDRLVIEALAGTAFEPLAVLINTQEFTKTANCWGVSNNKVGTNTNRIVVVRRI